jgi:hypothetical protein
MRGQQNIILRCTVSKTLYWDAQSAKHYTEMRSQQNIILRCAVSKILYWYARSAKHYNEMRGRQNIMLRCAVNKTLYWNAWSAKHYTELRVQQNIQRCTVSETLYWDVRSAKHYTEMHGQQNIKKKWYICCCYIITSIQIELSSVVYWHGSPNSTSQIRSHTCSTLCVSSGKSPSLPAIHCPHPAISHALTHHDTTVPHLIIRWPYYSLSQNFFAIPVSPWYTILVSSSSLDNGGYVGHYNNRGCCPLLQYFPLEYAVLRHCFNHHVYFQQLASVKTHKASCVMKMG